MAENKNIPLFWWSEIRLMGKKKENYGDLLSKYIVEKVSGKQANWVHPKMQAWYKFNKTHYLAAGSILAQATRNSIVWGSGIVDRKLKIARAKFYAVRGPETRSILIEQGHECPEVYGDPAILLPDLYSPNIQKKYEFGIIPHYVDYLEIFEKYRNIKEICVIDMMTLDIEKTTNEILACKKIISSSLHGLIVPHTYSIPALWIPFSDKVFGDNIKYYDYFKSVGINHYDVPEYRNGLDLEEISHFYQKSQVLPDPDLIKKIRKGLILNCPFRKEG